MTGCTLYAVIALAVAAVLIVLLPVMGMKDRNTPYAFSQQELARFSMVEKYRNRGVLPKHDSCACTTPRINATSIRKPP